MIGNKSNEARYIIELSDILDKHRDEEFFTCAENCWCWDLANVINAMEKTIIVGEKGE